MIFDVDIRVLDALWFILPAYFANSFPVNVTKIKELMWLGTPIDGGKTFLGHRILGDGKTWRGLYAGLIAGTLIGLVQQYFHAEAELFFQSLLHKSTFILTQMTFELAFMLSLGALLGDMAASFVKRQSGLKRGDPAPLLDQLDFILGAVFLSWFILGKINYNRFYVLVVITPIIHVAGNIAAWALKLKKKPW